MYMGDGRLAFALVPKKASEVQYRDSQIISTISEHLELELFTFKIIYFVDLNPYSYSNTILLCLVTNPIFHNIYGKNN